MGTFQDWFFEHKAGDIVLAKGFRINPTLFKISERRFARAARYNDVALPRRHYIGGSIELI
ncbi:hypothetical protein HN903_02150 [archaeon]|jgi:hypothetical protein|nr:hypothetical protein [archaeon]MBT7128534.1 hypothetical protein [archaeon]